MQHGDKHSADHRLIKPLPALILDDLPSIGVD